MQIAVCVLGQKKNAATLQQRRGVFAVWIRESASDSKEDTTTIEPEDEAPRDDQSGDHGRDLLERARFQENFGAAFVDNRPRRRHEAFDRVRKEEVAHAVEDDNALREEDRNRVHTDDGERERQPSEREDVDYQIEQSERKRGIAPDKADEGTVPKILVDREDEMPRKSDGDENGAA